MSRKKKQQPKSSSRRLRAAGEDRGSLALTVAWMLTAIAAAVATAVSLVAELLLLQFPPETGGAQPFAFVPGLFLLVATVTGLLCLTLTPVVIRVRRDPPPRSITLFAVIAGALPLVIVAWQTLFNSPA